MKDFLEVGRGDHTFSTSFFSVVVSAEMAPGFHMLVYTTLLDGNVITGLSVIVTLQILWKFVYF